MGWLNVQLGPDVVQAYKEQLTLILNRWNIIYPTASMTNMNYFHTNVVSQQQYSMYLNDQIKHLGVANIILFFSHMRKQVWKVETAHKSKR